MTRLRVALVASSYAPHVGGVEQHTAEVAALLQERGHEVEVWTVARDGHHSSRSVDGITVRDLPAPLPTRRLRGLARFLGAGPSAWWRWVRAWRSFRPDLLHVQCFGPNGLYALALSAVTPTPLVVSSHGETDADDNDIFRTSFLMPAGLRRAVRTARATTGCSASVVADLQDRFGATEAVVVPNGVAHLALGTVARVPRRVAGVGRLEHNKGFDLLLRAVALIEDVELVLVGDGRERGVLGRLAGELDIADRLLFTGVLSQHDTRQVMAGASVVVVPSRRESFGLVALEAWSAGAPLVATSTCGPAAFVTHDQDGILVDPRDTAALAAAIEDVLGHPVLARRLAAAGRESVKGYTWQAVVDRYEQIYARVLAG